MQRPYRVKKALHHHRRLEGAGEEQQAGETQEVDWRVRWRTRSLSGRVKLVIVVSLFVLLWEDLETRWNC